MWSYLKLGFDILYIYVQMACTKRVNFDGDDHGDKRIRPTMSNHKWHVESQVVEHVQPVVVDEPMVIDELVELVKPLKQQDPKATDVFPGGLEDTSLLTSYVDHMARSL